MHKQRWKPALLDQWAGSRDSGLGTSSSSLPDLPSQSTSSITHTATIPRSGPRGGFESRFQFTPLELLPAPGRGGVGRVGRTYPSKKLFSGAPVSPTAPPPATPPPRPARPPRLRSSSEASPPRPPRPLRPAPPAKPPRSPALAKLSLRRALRPAPAPPTRLQ